MTQPAAALRPNLVPGAYRGVAVTSFEGPLQSADLTRHFVGREAYRRTRFVVVRNGDETAIIEVHKDSDEPLFSPIATLRLLAGPTECAYVDAPEVDTAVPTALADTALSRAPGKRAVVVQGRYGHVNFIIDPSPLRVTVREATPPYPAKLTDQARRVLELAEDLPPIELVPDVMDLTDQAQVAPGTGLLLPCRSGDITVDGAAVDYLDERPPRRPWTLIGCERSQQIHEWFYGERAPQVDICPRKRQGGTGAILAKCCLLENRIEIEDKQVVVPWGATLAQIADALAALADEWEPTWAPA
jgi:hypothetical protein